MRRVNTTDRTIPDAGRYFIRKWGLEGAQRVASRRGDDARTEATANFYERLHHWLRSPEGEAMAKRYPRHRRKAPR